MRIIEKIKFENFEWLNSEDLPSSNGYKFELYSMRGLGIAEFILLFYSLFAKFSKDIYIGQLGDNAEWGDFCIDTWDIQNDRYDYSPTGKSKSTSGYLQMLIDNLIEPSYSGFCKCLDWDKFLPIVLDCVLSKTAPYSLMFYIPQSQIVFYFHHSDSFGVYYKEMNDDVRYIIAQAKIENLEIKYANDERLIELMR